MSLSSFLTVKASNQAASNDTKINSLESLDYTEESLSEFVISEDIQNQINRLAEEDPSNKDYLDSVIENFFEDVHTNSNDTWAQTLAYNESLTNEVFAKFEKEILALDKSYGVVSGSFAFTSANSSLDAFAVLHNVNYSIHGVCAEQAAIGTAITNGEQDFDVIVAVRGKEGEEIIPPCGNCRQILQDYMPDCDIIVSVCGELKKSRQKNFYLFPIRLNNFQFSKQ